MLNVRADGYFARWSLAGLHGKAIPARLWPPKRLNQRGPLFNMRQIRIAFLVPFLLGTTTALASSVSVGPITCSSRSDFIEMQDCITRKHSDGGASGRCKVITTYRGKKISTQVIGTMK